MSQLFKVSAGWAARPNRNTGVWRARASITGPCGISSAGPRGPSGVTTTTPPASMNRTASMNAWTLRLSARLSIVEDPRIAGKLSRRTILAISSPSGEFEISTRRCLDFSTRRQTTARAMRPCQKQAMAPGWPATTASTGVRFSNRQRIVASVAPR